MHTTWPKRFTDKVRIGSKTECWPWTGCVGKSQGRTHNYGMFWYRGRMHNSHRIALLFSGHDVPKDCVVMHKCDNPICCNPDHLKVADQLENIADAHRKGRAPIGQTHGMHKLTEADVLEIRKRHETAEKAAAKYGVARATINDIRQRVSWRHI